MSISIAAYNVEEYLAETLDSIVACKSLPDIDVLVVNDGSRDGTLNLALRYTERFPESIRVIDKPNGGYGSTINVSIKEAKGTYYRLLDGDDWVDSDELDKLVLFLKTTDSDLIVTKYSSVRGQESKTIFLDWPYDGRVLPIEERLDYRYAMHMLTFRTAPLCDTLMRYPIMENTNYTDFEFNVKGICGCKAVAYLDADVYRYRLGREGQSVELASWFRNIDKACEVTLHVAEYYEKVIARSPNIGEGLQGWALRQCVGSAKYKCNLMLMMGGGRDTAEHYKAFLRDLNNASPTVYSVLVQENANLHRIAASYSKFFFASLPKRLKALLLSCRGR